jgi:hypothetical protein
MTEWILGAALWAVCAILALPFLFALLNDGRPNRLLDEDDDRGGSYQPPLSYHRWSR